MFESGTVGLKRRHASKPLIISLLVAGGVVAAFLVAFNRHRLATDLSDLSSTDAGARASAAFRLGEEHEAGATGALIRALADSSPEVRGQVIQALGKIRTPEAMSGLAARLDSEDSAEIAKLLKSIDYQPGDPRSLLAFAIALRDWDTAAKCGAGGIPALMTLTQGKYLEDENVAVRRSAIETIARIQGAEAETALHPFLKDRDPVARALAAWRLRTAADSQAGTPQNILYSVERELDRYALVHHLDRLGWHPELPDRVHRWVVLGAFDELEKNWPAAKQVLAADLRSGVKSRMRPAVNILVRLGNKDALDDLVAALNRFGDEDMAEDFLNAGEFRLKVAAADWGLRRGLRVESRRGSQIGPQWNAR